MTILGYAKCAAKIANFFVISRPMEEKVNAVFEGLNEEQKNAVSCTEGPVLIVAGAGSGKTRVLTSRIALLLANEVDPARILALTFTKKAAGEMKERIAAMVGDRRARRLVMGTFHAVFVRFLREYAGFLGYPERFVIYDTADSQSAMKACIKELQLDDKVYKPREVLSRISMAKNNLVTPAGYRRNPELLIADSHSRKPRLCDLYELYQKKLKESGVMDFDDILLNMNILLRDNKDALQAISERFLYIMVDEYQDTNYAQYLILKKLSQLHRNICVVGDDSQSIYAFRGAKIENILNFKKDYPECHLFRLERNYRSTSTIVDAANTLIAHNEGRIPKECYAVGDTGDKIRILKAYTEQDEAVNIVSEIIARVRSDHAQYRDFAILYRTNSQSRALEEQLRRRNIPYMIYSGNSFFDRAEVKDMMAYFKLCINPDDNESFRRVVNKPARGIGGVTMNSVEEIAGIYNGIGPDSFPEWLRGLVSTLHPRKPIAGLDASRYGCVHATWYTDYTYAATGSITEWVKSANNPNGISVYYDIRSQVQDRYESGMCWNPSFILQAWFDNLGLSIDYDRLNNKEGFPGYIGNQYNKWAKDW